MHAVSIIASFKNHLKILPSSKVPLFYGSECVIRMCVFISVCPFACLFVCVCAFYTVFMYIVGFDGCIHL